MAAMHITSENFENEVLKSDKPVLLDFWATWCGPCKMLLPIVEELSEEREDIKICKVNADEEGDLTNKFKIKAIPTLIAIKDGEERRRLVGLKNKNEILELFL